MKHAWFLYSNDVVTGPFDTEDVKAKLATGQLSADSFIWWKGQREWMPIAAWHSQADQLVQTAIDRDKKPVWYIDSGQDPVGPLTETEMISHLRAMTSLSRVRLWAVGMQKWTSLFELADVMEALGLSRRENSRAPLMGTVAITRSNDDPKGFVLRTASISIGGLGITGRHDLRQGDTVSLLVKSPDISGNMHLRGEVAYVTPGGYAGIRFEKVPMECQSLIHDYVKRFNAEVTNVQAA